MVLENSTEWTDFSLFEESEEEDKPEGKLQSVSSVSEADLYNWVTNALEIQ